MKKRQGNFITLQRKLSKHWVSKDPVAFWLFIFVLLEANWKDGMQTLRKQRVKIKRGQYVTSDQMLADHIGVDRKTITKKLKLLENDGIFSLKRDNCGTIITVCKYEEYQSVKNKQRTSEGTSEGTSEWTSEWTHQNKENKENKDKQFLCRKISVVLTLAVGKLREQLGRPDVDIFSAAIRAEGYEAIGFEGTTLLKTKFPTWGQFAKEWIEQHRRGYTVAFERKLESDLLAVAEHINLFPETNDLNQNDDIV